MFFTINCSILLLSYLHSKVPQQLKIWLIYTMIFTIVKLIFFNMIFNNFGGFGRGTDTNKYLIEENSLVCMKKMFFCFFSNLTIFQSFICRHSRTILGVHWTFLFTLYDGNQITHWNGWCWKKYSSSSSIIFNCFSII